MDIKRIINWKQYFILLSLSVLSIIAILPYALTLQANLLQSLPIPLPLVLFLSVLQSTIIFAVLIFIGLKLSKKLGLKIPLIDSFISKEKIDAKPVIKSSILLGISVGLVIIILDIIFGDANTPLVPFQSNKLANKKIQS